MHLYCLNIFLWIRNVTQTAKDMSPIGENMFLIVRKRSLCLLATSFEGQKTKIPVFVRVTLLL